MKQIFTLLLLLSSAFGFKTQAQGTTCNAEFTVQYLTSNTVKFNPVMTTGAPAVSHFWNFGDGTPMDNTVSPTHSYANPGTYSVVHTVVLYTPNGVPQCTQSFTRSVVIAPPCNLQANFNWVPTTTNPLRIEFNNTTGGALPTDSVRWTFGDGTVLNGLMSNPSTASPAHTYPQPGTYTVCLRVKRAVNSTPNGCVSEICKTVVITAPPCNLQAGFNWTVSTNNPLRVEFHSTSAVVTPTDSIRWTFGDGSSLQGTLADTSLLTPVHTYAQGGTYTVCLRIKRNNNTGTTPCVSEICKTLVLNTTPPCNMQAYFTAQPDSMHPLRIKFTNMTTPVLPTDSVRWTFGDGTSVSGLQGDPNVANPTHIYAQAGTYTVCIRVKRNINTSPTPCVAEFCKQVLVNPPPPCNLQAYFTAVPDSLNPLHVLFHNQSPGVLPTDSIRWTFGDGTSLSGLQSDPAVANPVHVYAQPGTYNVCIRIKRNVTASPAPCVAEYCRQIVVPNTNPCNIPVNFSWQPDQVNPRKVYFTNQTVAPTSTATAVWTFGDGTSSNTWNAVHEYAQPGRYRVCLKITFGPNCVREKCDSILVPPPTPPCNNQSNFNFIRSTANSQTYSFIPVYQSTAAQYTWTFGDGTGSHDMVATHHYAQPGTYTACLTVWNGPNCASTTCKTIQVSPQINCDSVHVNYTYQPDPQVPNKLRFFANSNTPILDQTWTIKRLNGPAGTPTVILHQNNPTYLFQDTGYYSVCLRAVTLGGCVKEVCKTIHIAQVANSCILQAYPNPTSTVINVNVTLPQAEMIHAYIYNSQNILVREKHQQGVSGNNLVTMPVNDLPAGIYHIKLIYGNSVCYATFQRL